MSIDKKQIMRHVYKEWNKKNSGALDDLFTKNFIYHNVFLGPLEGGDATKEYFKKMFIGYPDVHFTIIDLIVDDEMCSIHARFEGTNTGYFYGRPPTDRKIDFEYVELYHFRGDKVVEGWQFYDLVNIRQQLGLMPVPS